MFGIFYNRIKAFRLGPHEVVRAGDWYVIPFGRTFFQVREEMIGKTTSENNEPWFRFSGFYRI